MKTTNSQEKKGSSFDVADDNSKLFARRIDALIEQTGSNTEFAKRCGVSESVVRSWKKGESDPSRKRLLAIARACNVNLDWLMKGEGEMRPGETVQAEITRSYPDSGRSDRRTEEPPITAEVSRSTDRRGKDVITLNAQVLCEIIEAIEKNLQQRDLELPPDRKALLIQFLYEQKMDSRHDIEETTKNFFKLLEK